ncbi:trypsin-like peptidase domain-containing protein [Mesobacillus maritimus]|uniref:S1C family serine protease n=1 Tax=Mesobacillus maritimus TaxID=1643336 RepID=UPI00203D7FC8|nr:trypsin-like peptidase domain-containing protein [Mesobacillus maritimus]MCM3588161.1 trypsin-like peptidase domain-containing protein [Mesobacillus maritimus]MCM3668904.1 trypsin-like peptidase domain-containing protein [Mesobacillus maritimus]
MGYYDGDQTTRYERQKGSKGKIFFASIAGAIIGGLIVIFSIPALANLGALPYNVGPKNGTETVTQPENNGTKASKSVSVNVQTAITEAVEKTSEAVVGITNIQSGRGFWFETNQSQEAGTGSGVIYKVDGDKAFVVTNFHVIEGAQDLEVTFSDGTKSPAKLVGGDPWTDLAVIEMNAENVKTVAEFGDSDQLQIGEPAIAIGNPLGLTFSGSVTQGIISGLERSIPVDIDQNGSADWQAEVLQTDAAINPGNSGGALVNIEGQVIGINSMKIAQSSVEGIGLAIPINYAIPVIEDLEQYGEVKRPYMGVSLSSVSEIPVRYQQSTLNLPEDINYGVAILEVAPNSPAGKAGLQEFDVIVEMDGEKIEDSVDLRKHLYNEKEAGDELKIKFYRNGKLQEATLLLVEENL